MNVVHCDYCGKPALFVGGLIIYPHRLDLRSKVFYYCEPCQAWVGCHPNTAVPLGRLANAELRSAKMAAHAAFDPLWRAGGQTRSSADDWAADDWEIFKSNGASPFDCLK